MKKFLTLLLTVVLTAAVAITGTVAYLQDTDEDVNVMTFGDVKIDQIEKERNGENIVDFTQDKPLYPAVGEAAWANEAQKWATGGSSMLFADSFENVVDKFVFVENTGISDAYVRTWFAFEVGEKTSAEFKELIGINWNTDHYDWTSQDQATWEIVEIGGNKYAVVCGTYLGNAGVDKNEHVNGVLGAGETTRPSLLQVYLANTADRADCEALDGNNNNRYDILVFSQAVQVKGFENAKVALETAFGTAHPWAKVVNEEVETSAQFEEALKNQEATTIIVSLEEDVTYDVAAWENDAMGGEATKTIIINGNGHTINFNQTNSDWNNITTKGAKLVINNAKLTNSGHNNGPWNRHDLNFACEVELNNVTSDKAFAFKAGATLNNVTINDANTSDTYAIWIQPNGQTVTLNNCTIDMIACTDGRGIKIDEQYVSEPEEVTLVVKNTTFKTEEKSAILVKSVAGAVITVENIDITGVAADNTNAVWVDEASADYAELVKVTGATVILEP